MIEPNVLAFTNCPQPLMVDEPETDVLLYKSKTFINMEK